MLGRLLRRSPFHITLFRKHKDLCFMSTYTSSTHHRIFPMRRSEKDHSRYGGSSINSRNNRAAPSSSSSSRSSASSTLPPLAPKKRTMEEVWKDISLCRPFITPHQQQQQQGLAPATFPSLRAMILQDFLAGPLNRAPAPATDEGFPAPPYAAPPTTALSLSPSPEIRLSPASNDTRSNSYRNSASFVSPAFSDTLPSPPSNIGLLSFYSRKAMPDNPPDSGDRRHKRMIKNRESAARSRARKQAYMNELEQEVAQLLQENSKLKKELKELRLAMAAKHLRRNTLQRSSSAHF